MHDNVNVDWDARRGAIFSECGTYRYYLWRKIDGNVRFNTRVAFVMLNPSTADENVDDPTIRKCSSFAQRWGFQWLDVVNLFAQRATDPKQLYGSSFRELVVGPNNNGWIADICSDADLTICAWGRHGSLHDRQINVMKHLPDRIHVLKLNSDGSPAHPLYLSYNLKPFAWHGFDRKVL